MIDSKAEEMKRDIFCSKKPLLTKRSYSPLYKVDVLGNDYHINHAR